MPNIKSAKKRVVVNGLKNQKNRAVKSALKTSMKKFDAALQGGADAAMPVFKSAVSGVDKAAAKGVLHKNTAARRKSQLARKLNEAQQH